MRESVKKEKEQIMKEIKKIKSHECVRVIEGEVGK